jgi:hypothetical protein
MNHKYCKYFHYLMYYLQLLFDAKKLSLTGVNFLINQTEYTLSC